MTVRSSGGLSDSDIEKMVQIVITNISLSLYIYIYAIYLLFDIDSDIEKMVQIIITIMINQEAMTI